MKTRTAQLTAITAIATIAAIIASPWVLAATSTTSTSQSSTSTSTTNAPSQSYAICQHGGGLRLGTGYPDWAGPPGGPFDIQSTVNLAIGQTISVTSSQGSYFDVGTPSNNGTASGTVTFAVTSKLAQGYTLSITSGNIVVGGTTYSILTGAAQTGPFADFIVGQGTTTPTGTFLLRGLARGSFSGTAGQLIIDFKAGSTEYAVALTGTIQT
jgi:hypothetical protein